MTFGEGDNMTVDRLAGRRLRVNLVPLNARFVSVANETGGIIKKGASLN